MNVALDEVVRQLAKTPLLFHQGRSELFESWNRDSGAADRGLFGAEVRGFYRRRILKPDGNERFVLLSAARKDGADRDGVRAEDGKLVRAQGTILGAILRNMRKGSVFPAPGWGLYSTAEDLLHVYRMMLNNGVYEGRRYCRRFPFI